MNLGYNKDSYVQPFDHRGSFQVKLFGWEGALTDVWKIEGLDRCEDSENCGSRAAHPQSCPPRPARQPRPTRDGRSPR